MNALRDQMLSDCVAEVEDTLCEYDTEERSSALQDGSLWGSLAYRYGDDIAQLALEEVASR